MDDPDGYFGEPVAASYDDPSDRMFQPEAIDPAVRPVPAPISKAPRRSPASSEGSFLRISGTCPFSWNRS